MAMNSVYSPRESGYYPPGAEFDPNAPWNEKELPLEMVSCTISSSLSKNVDVETSVCDGIHDFLDQDAEEQNMTPVQLIKELHNIAKDNLKLISNTSSADYAYWSNILEQSDGWTEDEFEVVE